MRFSLKKTTWVLAWDALQGDSSDLRPGLGWIGIWVFHCLPNSTCADWNLAEVVVQLGKKVEHPNQSQPNPGLRADESPCTQIKSSKMGIFDMSQFQNRISKLKQKIVSIELPPGSTRTSGRRASAFGGPTARTRSAARPTWDELYKNRSSRKTGA